MTTPKDSAFSYDKTIHHEPPTIHSLNLSRPSRDITPALMPAALLKFNEPRSLTTTAIMIDATKVLDQAMRGPRFRTLETLDIKYAWPEFQTLPFKNYNLKTLRIGSFVSIAFVKQVLEDCPNLRSAKFRIDMTDPSAKPLTLTHNSLEHLEIEWRFETHFYKPKLSRGQELLRKAGKFEPAGLALFDFRSLRIFQVNGYWCSGGSASSWDFSNMDKLERLEMNLCDVPDLKLSSSIQVLSMSQCNFFEPVDKNNSSVTSQRLSKLHTLTVQDTFEEYGLRQEVILADLADNTESGKLKNLTIILEDKTDGALFNQKAKIGRETFNQLIRKPWLEAVETLKVGCGLRKEAALELSARFPMLKTLDLA
jgi:hypothetical protein